MTKHILTAKQREAGLYLEENPETVRLMYKGKVLAEFSALGATILSIQEEADRQLSNIIGDIRFEPVKELV